MTLAAKPFCEPQEREDPRNALLDAAADLMRRCVELGCEPQLRARIDGVFPPPVAPEAAAPSGDVWEASVVLTALIEARRRVTAPASAKLIETATAFARQHFEAAKAAQMRTKR